MKALFISDLHLCEEMPRITHSLLGLLAGPAREVDALYILGDLFEYWAGDDDETPLSREVSVALKAVSATGVAVFFLPGNRDFLIGEDFALRAGLRILADPTVLDLDGQRTLIVHGDTLCTDDVAYQAYRRQVRSPAFVHEFLARPLAERKRFIDELRRQSAEAKQEKSQQIMDVNDGAVSALLREFGYPVLVHGHTHRPARHEHEVDGHTCTRWVLSDWDDDAPYLLWDGSAFLPKRFAPPHEHGPDAPPVRAE